MTPNIPNRIHIFLDERAAKRVIVQEMYEHYGIEVEVLKVTPRFNDSGLAAKYTRVTVLKLQYENIEFEASYRKSLDGSLYINDDYESQLQELKPTPKAKELERVHQRAD